MSKKFLETGKIVNTHGIKGELKVQPWTDTPNDLTKIEKLYLKDESLLKVVSSRVHKTTVLMQVENIDTIEAAQKLINQVVYLDRDDVKLNEGEYFIQDLFGLEAIDIDTNEVLGKITDVSHTGANDVWHIVKDGKEYLVPSIPDVVIDLDFENKKAYLRPLKGIFDEN